MNILMNNFRHLGFFTNPIRQMSVSVGAVAPVAPEADQLSIRNEARRDKLYKRIELEIRGHDPAVIKSYCKFTTLAASHLGIEIEKSWPLRKAMKDRYTLLKSVHIHKKHRVQYEFRTHYHFIHLARITESTSDTLLEYIERNLPEGIAMKVTKLEICPKLEHLVPPTEQELK